MQDIREGKADLDRLNSAIGELNVEKFLGVVTVSKLARYCMESKLN